MGQNYALDDTIRFGLTIHHPSGGALTEADETPKWYVFEDNSDTPILEGDFTARTGYIGIYKGSFIASEANGFNSNGYYEILASGKVGNIVDQTIIDKFVLDDIYDVNVVQVSGNRVHINDFGGTVYFADIKYIKDATNSRDEYTCHWFKNGQFVPSGSLQDPAISVYNTNTGSALFQNQRMTFASVNLGVVRYNDTSFLTPSGEPFLVEVSGLIDTSTRVWKQVIGLDIYY